jgi:hypothetical protein
VRARWRVAALSWCGELPGVRALAAAAVRFRSKASGRRMVRRIPAARRARLLLCASDLPPHCVRDYAPTGVRRAKARP